MGTFVCMMTCQAILLYTILCIIPPDVRSSQPDGLTDCRTACHALMIRTACHTAYTTAHDQLAAVVLCCTLCLCPIGGYFPHFDGLPRAGASPVISSLSPHPHPPIHHLLPLRAPPATFLKISEIMLIHSAKVSRTSGYRLCI